MWIYGYEVIPTYKPEEKPFDENLNTDYPLGTVGAWKHRDHWFLLEVKNGYWGKGVWCWPSGHIMVLAEFDENDPDKFIILETPTT